METILEDARRLCRAILDAWFSLRARERVSAAPVVTEKTAGVTKSETIRTGREEYEMYRRVTVDKMPPL
ncbi:MAG: hypothetical protein N3A02_04390 [Rectinema sp.]|nr:hypothetical protein [Rectinema sp.]